MNRERERGREEKGRRERERGRREEKGRLTDSCEKGTACGGG